MNPVITHQGDGPIILGQPHGGTFVPDDLAMRLNRLGKGLNDTDWHINRLYEGLLPDATTVQATFHRYIIDANRDPEGASLYPGKNTTSLCPLTDFDGEAIWQQGQSPSVDEIEARRLTYHAPYHAALSVEIQRVKQTHGFAILFDCHSIRSKIPFLFHGTLPIFSIGTDNGKTCDPLIEQATQNICTATAGCDHVTNGRFKGGWTTRHYGKPQSGVHTIQMELAQRAYMDETAPWTYRDDLALIIRRPLSEILHALNRLAL